jgi:PAS domain S-box-containing protein
MSRAANNLSKYFAKKKNFEKAYKYRVIADDAIDAISSMKTTKEIVREEMDYMFDQERMLVEKDKENKQKIIDQDKNLFMWMKVFCVLAALMSLVIILLFYKKKKKNEQLRKQRDTLQLRSRQLQIQQEEIAQKNHELSATTEMLEERNKELQMLSAVAANTGNSIYITTKEGKMIWFNDAFSRETHIPKEEIDTHPALKSSAMTPETRATYEKVIATKQTQIYTAEMKHLAGEPFWIQSYVTPILDDNGEISMIVWVSTNVTELHDAYEKIEDQNKEIPFELWGGRDGLYETNYVQFAIFSKDEVEEIIRELQTALKKGYSV